MTTPPTDEALRALQMAALPHTFPLCRCGEDHHSEAWKQGWDSRGEADAAARPAPVLDVEALAEAIRLVVLARDADDWALLDSTDPRIEQAPDLGDAIDDLRAAWRAYQTALPARTEGR